MEYGLTPEQRAWRQRVRDFIARVRTPDLDREVWEEGVDELGPEKRRFREAMAAEGLLGVTWPEDEGGLGLGATELYLMRAELDYHRLAELDFTYTAVAPIIMRDGTPENREDFLPGLRRGDIIVAVGYSEPDAGTDLAAMTTRAELVGDEWVINGQKLWNTRAHVCTHEWLCARTDPHEPRHKGLSVIMLPLDAPGIEIRPIETWGDERTNVTYFTNVRVPARNLIGEVNQGWRHITGALDLERLAVGHVGELRRELDSLLDAVLDGRAVVELDVALREVALLEADWDAAYLIGLQAATIFDRGEIPTVAATEHKILTSELRQRLAATGLRLLGAAGQLSWRDADAPLRGSFERLYRASPLLKFGAGANEVLRDVIAQRGEGLPSYGRSPKSSPPTPAEEVRP